MGTVSTTLPSDGQTVDASDVNTPINAILSEFNGNIDNDNIKTGANISGSKLGAATTPLSVLDTDGKAGWITGVLAAPNTVTNNGNRSYDLVFNSTDYTDELSEGMRLRLTRTVSAPTQCADLESGSSQYFSSASPAGISFTVTWTAMAWVKLESYVQSGIIGRRNADTEGWNFGVNGSGQLLAASLRIAGNNSVTTTYQSLPLNKWVHVAAAVDLAGTTLMYIDGVLVPSLTTVTGTAATLVQGTTALVVGANKSAGTDPWDGKIAQAAVFSSKLSAATIASYSSQTLSGSESTIVSAFSCSNTLLDLNTTNNNDLTANGGALMTNVDSPFGNYLGGTLDYAIITKTAFSTNTTLTVQVPEGCTIPTSGGVSAVAYSTQDTPYRFPSSEARWRLTSLHKTTDPTTNNATYGAFQSGGWALTVPIGAWKVGWQADTYNVTTTSIYWNISASALTGLTSAAGANASPFGARLVSPSAAAVASKTYVQQPVDLTSASTYVMYTVGATTSAGIDGTGALCEIFAECAYL